MQTIDLSKEKLMQFAPVAPATEASADRQLELSNFATGLIILNALAVGGPP